MQTKLESTNSTDGISDRGRVRTRGSWADGWFRRVGAMLLAGSVVLGGLSLTWAEPQETLPAPEQTGSQRSERQAELVELLKNLRRMEAGLGNRHPQMADVRKRIADAEEQLRVLRLGIDPFRDMTQDGADAQRIVERLSDAEMRVLLLRIVGEVKELRGRVSALERQ